MKVSSPKSAPNASVGRRAQNDSSIWLAWVASGGIVDGDVAEHVGSVLVLPLDHPRVVVPEQLEMRYAERLACTLELTEADAGDLGLFVALIARLDPARRVAELAVRARDDN